MPTQTVNADNGTRIVLLPTVPADPESPTAAELTAGIVLHCQVEEFDVTPSTKEYDAGSWCTGGQDPMVRSLAINFTIGNLTMKTMSDAPDTVRAAFSTGTTQALVWRVGNAETQDDTFVAAENVYVAPVSVGLVIDDPKKEGVRTYSAELSYAGGGKLATVAA